MANARFFKDSKDVSLFVSSLLCYRKNLEVRCKLGENSREGGRQETTEKKEKPKEEAVEEKRKEETRAAPQIKKNIVFVGSKPPMNYVLAIITSLSSSNAKEITLKARGRAITTAVDTTEIIRNRFMKDLQVSNIVLGTEEMPAREGESGARMVSTMEITLVRE